MGRFASREGPCRCAGYLEHTLLRFESKLGDRKAVLYAIVTTCSPLDSANFALQNPAQVTLQRVMIANAGGELQLIEMDLWSSSRRLAQAVGMFQRRR